MSSEKIYIMTAAYYLAESNNLLEKLDEIKKTDEVIFNSLGAAHHCWDILEATNKSSGIPTVAMVVFIDLKRYDSAFREIQTIRSEFPSSVFILYGDETEYKLFLSEVPRESVDKFRHYYRLQKEQGDVFRVKLRNLLDQARFTAIRKKESLLINLPHDQIKVLVVFANPKGSNPLRLGAEDRTIHESLALGKYRERIFLTIKHAATIHDVRHALLEDSYDIVQFSGHATERGLAFENDAGDMQLVPQEAFSEFISDYSPPIKCVILNACYTDVQGKLISKGVPFTIAMKSPISDDGAIQFIRGFYDAIVAGKDVEFAYREGCRTVKLSGLPDSSTPVLFKQS